MEQHLVQKYTFDVGFDSESKSFEFQNQLTAFIKDKIADLTDTVLTDSAAGKEIKIEKLTIDLGCIPLASFEHDFYSLLKSGLSDKLSMLLSGSGAVTPEEKAEITSTYDSNSKILEFFLIHGSLPWSAAKINQEFSIRKLMEQCLSEEPEKIKISLVALISSSQVQQRMIRQLDDELLWKTVEVFVKSELKHVQKFYTDLISLYKQKPLVKNYLSEFRELIWGFMLPRLLVKSDFVFNGRTWASGFIEYVSKATEKPVANVAQVFKEAIEENGKSGRKMGFDSSFSETASDLIKNKKTGSSNKSAGEKAEFEEFRQEQIRLKTHYLTNYLKVSPYSFYKDELSIQREKAETIITEFAQTHPTLLRKVFADAKLFIETFPAQQALEMFTPNVRVLVLKEIFNIDLKQFEAIKLETVKQALVSFLESGYFPYSVLPLDYKKADLDKLLTGLFITAKEDTLKIIKKAMLSLGRNEERIARVKKQLTVKTIRLLFSGYPSFVLSDAGATGSIEKEFLKLNQFKNADSIIHVFQKLIKEKKLAANAEFSVADLVDKFMSDFSEAAQVYFASVSEKEFKVLQAAVPSVRAKKMVKNREDLAKSAREIKQTIQLDKDSSREEAQNTGLANERPKTGSRNEEVKRDAEYNFKKPLEDPIYINNAGLVIFHPYLTRFFTILGLLEKKEFKDEYSSHKAVYLLQYLVNKGLNSEEHELVLNKLLCGIDTTVPLIRDIEITEEEKKTCESLIEGVIQNWPILKKTSNDNFRGSFLIREGKLTLNDHQWKLKVEERGYDILVEKIPWALSMVKLQWMKKMLNVEWK